MFLVLLVDFTSKSLKVIVAVVVLCVEVFAWIFQACGFHAIISLAMCSYEWKVHLVVFIVARGFLHIWMNYFMIIVLMYLY